MPTTLPDGAVWYQGGDDITDVTYFGVSVLDKGPVEIKVWPGGWGYILLKKQLDGTAKTQVDGTLRLYTYYGEIVVS